MTEPPRHPAYPPPLAGPPPAPPQAGPPLAGPVRIEPVEGTDFGLAYARVAPVRSGPAIGALIAGIGSILVSLVEICLGLAGSTRGWGALVSGAFAILSFLLGLGAAGLGTSARRAIKRAEGVIDGGGIAFAGLVCGLTGMVLAVFGFASTLLATVAG